MENSDGNTFPFLPFLKKIAFTLTPAAQHTLSTSRCLCVTDRLLVPNLSVVAALSGERLPGVQLHRPHPGAARQHTEKNGAGLSPTPIPTTPSASLTHSHHSPVCESNERWVAMCSVWTNWKRGRMCAHSHPPSSLDTFFLHFFRRQERKSQSEAREL